MEEGKVCMECDDDTTQEKGGNVFLKRVFMCESAVDMFKPIKSVSMACCRK